MIILKKIKQIIITIYTSIMFNLKETRPMIQSIKHKYDLKNGLIGAEIGVREGRNACNILSELNMKKLYLIDPYVEFQNRDITFNHSGCLEIAKKNLSRFKEKVEFIVEESKDAVDKIPSKLDFVYIDGNHDYEYVKNDIMLYYPKIKMGGIIGGHDFRSDYHGLMKAVIEFSEKNNLKIYGLNNEGEDWWIIKK